MVPLATGVLPDPRLLNGYASTEATRHQAAAVIQRCYRWFEATVPVAPDVSALVPGLVTAAQQYAAEQYGAALGGALSVLRSAQTLRAGVPALPVP